MRMELRFAVLMAGIFVSLQCAFSMEDRQAYEKARKEREILNPNCRTSFSPSTDVVLSGYTDTVMDLEYVDKTTLVSTSADGTIKFWSLDKLECRRIVTKVHKGISFLASNGDCFVSSGFNDKRVGLWNPISGKLIKNLQFEDANPEHLVMADNVALIGFFSGADKPVLWDIRCREKVVLNVCSSVFSRSIGIDAQAKRVAFSEANGGVSLWEIGYDKPVSEYFPLGKRSVAKLGKQAVVDAITFDHEQQQMICAGYCADGQEALAVVDMVSEKKKTVLKESRKMISDSFNAGPVLSVAMLSNESDKSGKDRRYLTLTAGSLKFWQDSSVRKHLSSKSKSFHAVRVHPKGEKVALAEGNHIRLTHLSENSK